MTTQITQIMAQRILRVACSHGNWPLCEFKADPMIILLFIALLLAKHNLGAFFAPQKTGLCGAPRSRAPAPTFGRLRPNAVAAPHPSNPLRSWHPLPGVSPIPVRSFAYAKPRKKSRAVNLGGQCEGRREVCGRTRRCASVPASDGGCPRPALRLRRAGFAAHLAPSSSHKCRFISKSS
jgi:hypothetical protein